MEEDTVTKDKVVEEVDAAVVADAVTKADAVVAEGGTKTKGVKTKATIRGTIMATNS